MDTVARERKLIIALAGLPARGKTYIHRKLRRYLYWLGYNVRGFDISNYRRTYCGTETDANFFDPNNPEGEEALFRVRMMAMNDMLSFLDKEGDVAILDATHATLERRQETTDHISKHSNNKYSLVWLESVCDDEKLIQENIHQLSKAPEYTGKSYDDAYADYLSRIDKYKRIYVPISPEVDGKDISFIKLLNFNQEIVLYNVSGYLPSKIGSYVMNLHTVTRPIYFSRHGESLYNVEDRVGGDPELSEAGMRYAVLLNDFYQTEAKLGGLKNYDKSKIKILTSTLKRSIITASHVNIGVKPVALKPLEEINVGMCEGMTYAQIAKEYPDIEKERKADKLRYRYPRGESYLDMINRLEPVLFAIERSRDPVIIVGHQGILRCLYAYFTRNDIEQIPHIDIPLHCIFRIVPEAYDVDERRYTIDIKTGECTVTEILKTPRLNKDYRSM